MYSMFPNCCCIMVWRKRDVENILAEIGCPAPQSVFLFMGRVCVGGYSRPVVLKTGASVEPLLTRRYSMASEAGALKGTRSKKLLGSAGLLVAGSVLPTRRQPQPSVVVQVVAACAAMRFLEEFAMACERTGCSSCRTVIAQ